MAVFSDEVMSDSVGPTPNNEVHERGSVVSTASTTDSAGFNGSCVGSSQEDLTVNTQGPNRYVGKKGSINVSKNSIQKSVIPRRKSPTAKNEAEY